jgi:bacillithiol biosynthesis cysteine-adding enzyme BshC
MTDDLTTASFHLIPRAVADAGSLAAEILAGGAATELFRGVVGADRVDTPFPRPGRLTPGAFTTTSATSGGKLEKILAGGGHFVTTGQQPGLFLGPLYTLYKAASAIKLAADLERSSGLPTLAVFWVAADDHDWREVAGCRVLAADESLVDLRVETPEGRSGRSVGETALPESIRDNLESLTQLFDRNKDHDADVGSDQLAALRASYRPGETFSGAFISAMAGLFTAHELALVDSSDPELRAVASGLYRDVAARAPEVADAMANGRTMVEQTGYAVQLTPPESGLQLFFDTAAGRAHVLATGAEFGTAGGERWTAESLDSNLESQASSFTPAAALRPVLESWLLPVAASVLGPGELAYWAQLRPLFETLRVEMPLVAARDSWRLVEPRVARLLGKLGVDSELVERGEDELRRQVLEAGRPRRVAQALAELHTGITDRLQQLAGAADEELPGLRSATGKAVSAVEGALEDLGRAVDRQVAERQATALGQARRLTANLAPGGIVQERAVGAASYLGRYGSRLVDRLVATESRYIAGLQGQD